jgi:hypothetical protein
MNDRRDFERLFADRMEAERRSPGLPEAFYDDFRQRAGEVRQRPRWLALIKEPPMRYSSRLAVGSPTVRVATFVILLLILSALTAGAVVGGASLLVSPAPALAANGLIAYDASGDIWVVNADGTEPRQLTSGPTVEHGATWSRDGSRIAYWATEGATAPDTLVVADAAGSDPRTIATHEPGRASELLAGRDLDWSPDGQHVAYSICTVADASCEERVFVAATDGSGTSQVGDEGLTAWRPRWSPDGSLLAFSGHRDGVEQGVYLMAPDGTDVRRISAVVDDEAFGFFSVSWSPDGTSIATKATPGIWLIPVGPHDPSDEVLLARQDSVVPTWSPDGSQVAYVDLGASRLRVVPVAGGDDVDLGSLGEGGYAWAPDGGSIVAQRCYTGACGFEIVDSLTGEHVAGIEVGDPGRFPSWQPRSQ